jgi:hypothetical protein
MTHRIRSTFCAMLLTLSLQPAQALDQRLCLRLPAEEKVAFNGIVSYDAAGSGAGSMLYPAPGLAGFMAAIATHGFIANAARDGEKQKLRDKANEVLLPYQPLLANYKHPELMQASLETIAARGDKRVLAAAATAAEGETVIDSVPAYYMTQDQRALVLENAIAIKAEGGAKPYANVIRVVSPASADKEPAKSWLDAEGAKLKLASTRMFAHSIDIALNDMKSGGAGAAPFKTVRYQEGEVERMERAQVISEDCEQLVIRTLRGNLMSVPRKAVAGCNGAVEASR